MDFEINKETLSQAYKPFDIVTNENGDVGFISEVNVNHCQDNPIHQISYSVVWLVGSENKCSWFENDELTYHCNLFIEIAKSACHGQNERHVQTLFNFMNRGDDDSGPTIELTELD